MRQASLVVALSAALVLSAGCNKDTAKPDETKKAEATPVPSGMVFNDFLPSTGNATGLGVRDSGLEGGLAGVAAGGGAPAGDSPESAPPGEGAAPEKLKVVEPGAEPRALRRYTFVANRVDKRVLTITQSMSQSMQGQTSSPQEIVLKLSLDITPKQIKPAGAVMEAKVTKVELPGAPPQAVAMLSSMAGLTGVFEVSARGEAGEVQFTSAAQMKNQLAETVVQALSQASQLFLAPFPDAPVGAGAKWEVGGGAAKADMADQGVKRFTLREVSGEGGVVDATIDIKVPRRPQQGPRGAVMFVEVDGKGKYTYQLRFDHVSTKVEGELVLNEKIEASDPKGGGKQTVVQVQKAKHLLEAAK
jgi:hypothetical protein